MNVTFTNDEINLMCIYNTSDRNGLIAALREMREYLEPQETELMGLTDSVLTKLNVMGDTDFSELELFPDF